MTRSARIALALAVLALAGCNGVHNRNNPNASPPPPPPNGGNV